MASKPYSDLYEYALKKTNVKRDEIITIEDSQTGIISALNAHLKVICIKDLSIIANDLSSKCLLSVLSLNDVLDFFKYKGAKNGNN